MSNRWAPTVQRLLHREMSRYADRACLVWEGGQATYADTLRRCEAMATWLQGASAPGARVAIALPNGREFVESIAAVAIAGRVRVPLNPKESSETLSTKVDLVSCAVLITSSTVLAKLDPEVVARVSHVVLTDGDAQDSYAAVVEGTGGDPLRLESEAADVYRISFTGGTTGAPKAIVQTHRQETAMIRNLLMETIRPDASTTFVAATPLSHASGAFVVPTLLRGGAIAWTESFDAGRLVEPGWLGREGDIETFLVPTAMADVSRAVRDRGEHRVRTLVYGGAPCPPDTLKEAVDALGPCLVQVYGQAEAPMTIAVLSREAHQDLERASGSVGHPFLFVDVAILDEAGERLPAGEVGEVLVAAEHVMSGYWTDSGELDVPAELADGWLHTGDLGMIDQDGYLRLVGRARNMIISGGVNLYPDDIDRRLSGLTDTSQLVSFGVPHPRWGEALVLAVVPSDRSLPEADLVERVEAVARERLSAYERPKAVIVLDEMPLTDVGKTDTRRLAEMHAQLFETSRVG